MSASAAIPRSYKTVAILAEATDAAVQVPRIHQLQPRRRSWGDWLHKALETYRIPSRLVGRETTAGMIPKSLSPIFRDRDELPSATDLNRKVNEALAQSANLIVICSPRSAVSRWVNEEILAYKRLGRADRVFCLIVDGEPNASDLPGRAAEECFARRCVMSLAPMASPPANAPSRSPPTRVPARTARATPSSSWCRDCLTSASTNSSNANCSDATGAWRR